MSLPQVVNKLGNSAAPVRPSNDGIAVFIATSSSGPTLVPSGFFDWNAAVPTFGIGPLLEQAALHQPIAKKKFILIRPNTSVAAVIGTITQVGTGTSIMSAHSGSAPYDDYNVLIKIVVGGSRGVAGVTYTYSLDGGLVTSAVQALGTATSITIPNTGIQVDLATGTFVANDTYAFTTKAARMNNANLVEALATLKRTAQTWEVVYPHMDVAAADVTTLDTWLQTLETAGDYQHSAIANFRARAQDGTETEAQYLAAFQTAFGTTTTPRVVVCADCQQTVSPITGLTQTRYAALAVLSRAMSIDISVDPAQQGDGALPGTVIADGNGIPIFHDEQHDPGLDDARATTLRSFPGYTGAYVTNANLLSDPTTKYKYWQHIRLMGRARAISSQVLTARLSAGVRVDQSTGFILESDAAEIDGLVQSKLDPEFITSQPRRVSAIVFRLSRTDPLTSDSPPLSGSLQMVAKKYVKGFNVTSTIVDTVTST